MYYGWEAAWRMEMILFLVFYFSWIDSWFILIWSMFYRFCTTFFFFFDVFSNILPTCNLGLHQINWLINFSILLFFHLIIFVAWHTEAVYIGYCIVPIFDLMRRGGCVWLLMWYELKCLCSFFFYLWLKKENTIRVRIRYSP